MLTKDFPKVFQFPTSMQVAKGDGLYNLESWQQSPNLEHNLSHWQLLSIEKSMASPGGQDDLFWQLEQKGKTKIT